MVAAQIAKALFAAVLVRTVRCSSLGRDNGFGNSYVWAGSLESGMQIATNHKKPVMLIIHKSWCTACKKLKPKFASSSEIQALSKHFVMINLLDEEEPNNNTFAPDGNYIPRILFMSPEGLIEHDIYNEEGSSQYKFFYSKPEQIAKSMRRVLNKYNLEKFDAPVYKRVAYKSGLQAGVSRLPSCIQNQIFKSNDPGLMKKQKQNNR